MRIERRSLTRVRLGVAIDADVLVAHATPALLAGGVCSLPLAGVPGADGCWPELETALVELRAMLPPDARVSASIALLLPLVQLRRITLPSLTPDERRRVLSRDAGRWFVGARESFTVDALPVSGARGEIIAAAIPSRYANAIGRAAGTARMEVHTVQAAPWAWAASVRAAKVRPVRAAVVSGSHSTDVLWLDHGSVTGIRRVRSGERAVSQLHDVLGDDESNGAVQHIADGASLAARFAHGARGPELLAEPARAHRRAVVARRTRWLATATAAVLLLAAGVELWGTRRQLAIVRAERAALRDRVSRAMASRDSATALEAQLGAVVSEVSEAPRWTSVIARLADRLPDGAWLQSLSASGDSVSLVGASAQAGDVFEALRRDPAIAGVRADAPIRRETSGDRAPVEHYGVTIRLTRAAMSAIPEPTP
jgi:hypothetical protein